MHRHSEPARTATIRPLTVDWLAALADHNLDQLSPPELELAVHELTCDRGAFLDVVARVSDYPRRSIWGQRRPDPDEIERLDRELPTSRAVILADEPALDTLVASFEAVLVLDPFWSASDLLYDAWHSKAGITDAHAAWLLGMLQSSVRLASATSSVRFIPDHLPGSWTPFPIPARLADRADAAQVRMFVGSQAARLIYWGDQLGAVAATSHRQVGAILIDLACAGRDLNGLPAQPTVVRLPRRLPDVVQAEAFPSTAQDEAGEAWLLGAGSAVLPDVALVLRRLRDSRPLRSGHPGQAYSLRQQTRFLVRASS